MMGDKDVRCEITVRRNGEFFLARPIVVTATEQDLTDLARGLEKMLAILGNRSEFVVSIQEVDAEPRPL